MEAPEMDLLSKFVVSAITKIALKSTLLDSRPFCVAQDREDGFTSIFIPQGKTEKGKVRKAYWRQDPRERKKEAKSAKRLTQSFSVETIRSRAPYAPYEDKSVYKNHFNSVIGDIGRVLNLGDALTKRSFELNSKNIIGVRETGGAFGYYVPSGKYYFPTREEGSKGSIYLEPTRDTNSRKQETEDYSSDNEQRMLIELATRSNVLTHEIGHKIDFELFGDSNELPLSGTNIESPHHRQLTEWKNAVETSKAYNRFFDSPNKDLDDDFIDLTHSRDLGYYTNPTELFARSFEQYISTKLNRASGYHKISEISPVYWSKEDFRPIEKAMDKMFEKKGWLNTRYKRKDSFVFNTNYLMGAMLDPLVVEFMPPAYCEAMLEAKIRTDEIRGNCPPRAGYVCVLDPRVKTGRYYRKGVEGQGVNALPPSRIEKALAQQDQRSQKGEGISFLGKTAIAGGLAIGVLAVIGAIANSGRSSEPVPDIPNAKKPDTSVKPKSSTYEEAKQAAKEETFALSAARERKIKPPVETVNNEVFTTFPKDSPEQARRKRGGNPKTPDEIQAEIDNAQEENDKFKSESKKSKGAVVKSPQAARRQRGSVPQQAEAIAQQTETLKQEITQQKPASQPVPLTKTTQVTPNPVVTPAKKGKIDITGMSTKSASHAVLENDYNNLPDAAGKLNVGYKSSLNIRNALDEADVLRRSYLVNPSPDDKLSDSKKREAFERLLDSDSLVKDGYLVQKSPTKGGYGKDNTGMIRIPAFMPIKDFEEAVSNIETPKGVRVRTTEEQRLKAGQDLIEAINEKIDKTKLTDIEKGALELYRTRTVTQMTSDRAKLDKTPLPEISKIKEPTPKPKAVQPEFKSPEGKQIMGVLGEDIKAIAQSFKGMDAKQQQKLNNLADNLSPEEAGTMAAYLKGLSFNNIKVAGAAPARTAFANRLEAIVNKAKPTILVVGGDKPSAIAEKPPEIDTIPLGKSTTQVPVVRPERAKSDNYAAAQREQRAIVAAERAAEETKNPSTPKSFVDNESLIKQAETIKSRTATLQQQLAAKEISAKDYDKEIGELRKPLINNVTVGEDGKPQPIESYIAKTNARYKALDMEIKQLLGSDDYMYGGGWVGKPAEIQALANAKLDEMKGIERGQYNSLGLKYSDQLKFEAKNPSSPKSSVDNPVNTPVEVIENNAIAPTQSKKFKSEYFEKETRQKEQDGIPVSLESLEEESRKLKATLEKIQKEGPKRFSKSEKEDIEKYGGYLTGSSTWRTKDNLRDYQEDLLNEIARRKNTKKQNNDAIAPHETYYSAKEQAKQNALRRFAA